MRQRRISVNRVSITMLKYPMHTYVLYQVNSKRPAITYMVIPRTWFANNRTGR